jgi:hypothetical protein
LPAPLDTPWTISAVTSPTYAERVVGPVIRDNLIV